MNHRSLCNDAGLVDVETIRKLCHDSETTGEMTSNFKLFIITRGKNTKTHILKQYYRAWTHYIFTNVETQELCIPTEWYREMGNFFKGLKNAEVQRVRELKE